MAKVFLGSTMSLDGFINDRSGSVAALSPYKHVTIIAATSITRQCLAAGLADELHIDIMPVLLFAHCFAGQQGIRVFVFFIRGWPSSLPYLHPPQRIPPQRLPIHRHPQPRSLRHTDRTVRIERKDLVGDILVIIPLGG